MASSAEYVHRLQMREALAARVKEHDERVGSARLLIAGVTFTAAGFSLFAHAFSPLWLLASVALFAGAVFHHQAVRRKLLVAQRAVNFYRTGLARMADDWPRRSRGGQFDDPHHVYSADLDLFGESSLFGLLSVARTRMGEETLARWLLAPAALDTVLGRQEAVADLRNRLDLREELAVLGEDSRPGVYPQALLAWADARNVLQSPWIRGARFILPALLLASVFVWILWGLVSPFLAVLMLEAGCFYLLKGRLQAVLSATESAFEDLKLFAALLTRVEREHFESPLLKELLAKLRSHTLDASHAITRLNTIASFVEARRNPIVATLNVPLMYVVSAALMAERWRRDHGHVVRLWVEALGEIEALVSLGAYSYEHPEDPFPEFVAGPPQFSALRLGHPLIPADRCVRNDVEIGGKAAKVLMVSGSNMSGKSTLLRAVGINTVLAMAGAPVRARSLKLTPLQVGASIRANDSLQEGSSRFYAEITRLRQLHDLMGGDPPLLFLLDELLQGTNSEDRRVGAEGIVGAFARQSVGLVSTHDLVLTAIATLHEGELRNVHFQDELKNGAMTFDFQLRDGVVTKSNGVELMRAIGLRV